MVPKALNGIIDDDDGAIYYIGFDWHVTHKLNNIEHTVEIRLEYWEENYVSFQLFLYLANAPLLVLFYLQCYSVV